MSNFINPFDIEYNRITNNILTNGTWQLNERTGKQSLMYHGDMMKFDLSTGKFPLLTTKLIYTRQMIAEALGFIRGYDNAEQFRDLGCNFWNANANESKHWLDNPNRKGVDDLGRIYGVQARGFQSFQFVKHQYKETPTPNVIIPKFDKCEPDYTSNKNNMVGKIYNSLNWGEFIVIKETEIKGNTSNEFRYDCQFLNTNYIKYNVQLSKINQRHVKDPYHKSVANVGCYGIPKDRKLSKLLKSVWRDMIYQCYTTNKENSKPYQGEDIFVDNRWLNFEYFVQDFKKIRNWELKLEFPKLYSLDKDYSGANYYSEKTCTWASKREQVINSSQSQTFGYWRLNINDQLATAIAKIKHNPSDRRIMVSHWNPNELHMMSLPPCHVSYTFGIRGKYLDVSLFQRSIDFCLGAPMNIASYAWLTCVIAKITGLIPGVFTHFMHNIHIYEDQIEGAKIQMTRDSFEAPSLEINDNIKTLTDLETWVTPSDFKFINYQHHPAIYFPFSA